jgi:hypothetical protein
VGVPALELGNEDGTEAGVANADALAEEAAAAAAAEESTLSPTRSLHVPGSCDGGEVCRWLWDVGEMDVARVETPESFEVDVARLSGLTPGSIAAVAADTGGTGRTLLEELARDADTGGGDIPGPRIEYGFGLSLPVGPFPNGTRLAGGMFSAARRRSFSSSSSETRSSIAWCVVGAYSWGIKEDRKGR